MLLIISGCAMLKRTSTETDKENLTAVQDIKSSSASTLDSTAQQEYLSLSKLSDQSSYQIRMWPKGKIIYHSTESFEGEFDSIKMTGTLKRREHIATVSGNSSKLKKDQQLVSEQHNVLKANRKTKLKKKFPDYLVITIIAVLFLFGLYFILKKIRNRVR